MHYYPVTTHILKKPKARLVVKGFAQQPRIDYGEKKFLVARSDTIKVVLVIASQQKWLVYQMKVKPYFLNLILDGDVYVDQPSGFELKWKEYKVCILKKEL